MSWKEYWSKSVHFANYSFGNLKNIHGMIRSNHWNDSSEKFPTKERNLPCQPCRRFWMWSRRSQKQEFLELGKNIGYLLSRRWIHRSFWFAICSFGNLNIYARLDGQCLNNPMRRKAIILNWSAQNKGILRITKL